LRPRGNPRPSGRGGGQLVGPKFAYKSAIPKTFVNRWNKLLFKLLENLAAPYSILSRVLPQLIILAVIVYLSSAVYVYYQHLDWISAVYAGVSLVTTIGLYSPNLNTMPTSEKVYLIVIMATAVATYASVFTGIVSVLSKRYLWVDARGRWRGSHMRGHVVIAGNSIEIVEAAKKLESLGEEYVVLTNNQDLASKLGRDRVIIGDPTHDEDLKAAGIQRAKSAMVMMNEDNESLLVTLRIQRLNPPLRVVVGIKEDTMRDVFETAGADLVFSIRRMAGRIMASAAISGNIGGYMLDASGIGEMSIGVFNVEPGSEMDGSPLSRIPEGIIPILIVRDGKLNPYFTRETKVSGGEIIVVLGDPKNFTKLKEITRSRVSEPPL